jgi:hypothetical protein
MQFKAACVSHATLVAEKEKLVEEVGGLIMHARIDVCITACMHSQRVM